MAGCLDNAQLPSLPSFLNLGEKRNQLASVTSGSLFSLGWWLAIDVAVAYGGGKDFRIVYLLCGIFGTLAMFMVNAVSSGQLRGESYTTGCIGVRGARVWFFAGFLVAFGALIGAGWILFGDYVFDNPNFKPDTMYPGVAIFLSNLLIFGSNLVFKFGRSEDLWG